MQHFYSVFSDTLIATTVFEAFDFVDFNDAKITADDAAVKAMALNPASEVGMAVSGMMIGTARVRARGAITKGQKLITAAAGGVKAAAGGSVNPFAQALSDAADGAFVNIIIR